MKRTDMINHIREVWSGYSMDGEAANLGKFTEHLLLSMENLGMAPPEVPEPCPTHYQDAMGKVVRGEDSTLFVRRWEDG